jgi:hypothetical protein
MIVKKIPIRRLKLRPLNPEAPPHPGPLPRFAAERETNSNLGNWTESLPLLRVQFKSISPIAMRFTIYDLEKAPSSKLQVPEKLQSPSFIGAAPLQRADENVLHFAPWLNVATLKQIQQQFGLADE